MNKLQLLDAIKSMPDMTEVEVTGIYGEHTTNISISTVPRDDISCPVSGCNHHHTRWIIQIKTDIGG